MAENLKIQQGNVEVFSGDKTSIMIMFNNMTGKNFDLEKEYSKYKDYKNLVAHAGMVLDKPFEVVQEGKIIYRGTFK